MRPRPSDDTHPRPTLPPRLHPLDHSGDAVTVLSHFKWPETLETDFIYSASSIGTSINPQFIANFASAAGKRSNHDFDSEEYDPEWGCWTAGHELKKPSISLLFPTIERVKSGACGIQLSRYLLSLPEIDFSFQNFNYLHNLLIRELMVHQRNHICSASEAITDKIIIVPQLQYECADAYGPYVFVYIVIL